MIRFVKYALLLSSVVAMAGCNRPKAIPDAELASIIREIYLSNGYAQSVAGISLHADSIDIYQPVLAAHGYSIDDFRYTMIDFTKRKSSRLSDIVQEAVDRMETEKTSFDQQLALIDTVDARMIRMFREVVLSPDTAIVARRIADTAKLEINIPVHAGDYEIKYKSYLDSLDKNKNLKSTFTVIGKDGRRGRTLTQWHSMGRWQPYSAELQTSASDSVIELRFGNYPAKDITTPRLTIDSLRVIYSPTLEMAADSLAERYMIFNIIDLDNAFAPDPPDSGALSLYRGLLP